MSTVRRGRMAADDYMTVARKFARDSRLSLKERGLGLWLFSHTDGWNLSVRSIAKQVGAGVEAVQSGLKALEEFGYLRRERQYGDGHQFADMDYVVTDVPEDVPAGEATSGKPVHGDDQDPGYPSAGKPTDRVSDTHKETTPKETNSQGDQPQEEISPNGHAVMDDGLFPVGAPEASNGDAPASEIDGPTFVDFWAVYPVKKAKQKAVQAWERALLKVPKADRGDRARAILEGAHRYAEERKGQDPRYTKHPATWLNGGCWDDEPTPVGSGRNPRGGGSRYRDSESYPDAPAWFDPAALDDA